MTAETIETDRATNQRCEFLLLGMHCASCAGRIEKALNKAPGVDEATVNFATTRATVNYNPQQTSPQQLHEVVKNAGYDVIAPQPSTPATKGREAQGGTADEIFDVENEARAAEYSAQKRKFIIALALTIPVAVLAMGSHISAL